MLNQEIQTLKQGLNQFGLDPRDWKLIRQSPKHYRIESVADENFVFLGRIFKQGTKIFWDQIQLAEI